MKRYQLTFGVLTVFLTVSGMTGEYKNTQRNIQSIPTNTSRFGFAIPSGFHFLKAPHALSEIWTAPQSQGGLLQISVISDLSKNINGKEDAKRYLEELARLRQVGLVQFGVLNVKFSTLSAKKPRGLNFIVFDLEGTYEDITRKKMHFIERQYVRGTGVYEVLYTEPSSAKSQKSQIQASLASFMPPGKNQ